MQPDPTWTVLGRSPRFAGGPIREVAIEHVRLPDGTEIEDYYRVTMADFALVFAAMDDGRVMMLRQYKHGAGRVCLTFPGGALGDGETPIDAARRELLEETGCVAERWASYGAYVTNANQYCNRAHLFRADGCRRVSSPTSPDLERPELVIVAEHELLQPDVLPRIGLASHVALIAVATHPQLRHRDVLKAEGPSPA
jgi:ADP-ribose pyrophosphatase